MISQIANHWSFRFDMTMRYGRKRFGHLKIETGRFEKNIIKVMKHQWQNWSLSITNKIILRKDPLSKTIIYMLKYIPKQIDYRSSSQHFHDDIIQLSCDFHFWNILNTTRSRATEIPRCKHSTENNKIFLYL